MAVCDPCGLAERWDEKLPTPSLFPSRSRQRVAICNPFSIAEPATGQPSATPLRRSFHRGAGNGWLSAIPRKSPGKRGVKTDGAGAMTNANYLIAVCHGRTQTRAAGQTVFSEELEGRPGRFSDHQERLPSWRCLSPFFPVSRWDGRGTQRKTPAARGRRSTQTGHVSAPDDTWAETGWNKPMPGAQRPAPSKRISRRHERPGCRAFRSPASGSQCVGRN